jgi:hypothetical protein
MSQNPAHTPRRALSPPAVTRFQLRTASASEAVFSPPYVPARPEAARTAPPPPAQPITPEPFPEPTVRKPISLPRPTRNLELPRPAPPTHALDLPGIPEPVRPATERTEPGTWREIIARFEHELGQAPEPEAPTEAKEPAEVDASAAETPQADVELPAEREPTVAAGPPAGVEEPRDEVEPTVEAEPPAGVGELREEEEERLDQPVPWEFEAMTTADYTPPRSIHDPEHDSWPVDAADGDAVPAWSDDEAEGDVQASDDASTYDEIGEMILDEVAQPDPWDVEPEQGEAAAGDADFPLNAFIVPAGVQRVPSGYENRDVARRVAHRLDELAQLLRAGGLGALGRADSIDELSRVLAAIVTGYVSRDA